MLGFDLYSLCPVDEAIFSELIISIDRFYYYFLIFTDWYFSIDYIFDNNTNSWQILNDNFSYKYWLLYNLYWFDLKNYLYYNLFLDYLDQFYLLNYFVHFNFVFFSQEWFFIHMYCEELYFSTEFLNLMIKNFIFYANFLNINLSIVEGHYIVFQSIFDFLFFFFFLILLLLVGITCYHNIFLEDNSVDHDYINCMLVILSEKELNSFDDMSNLIFILLFFFGWFLYFYSLNHIIFFYDISMILLFLPLLNYLLLLIPFFLLLDFSYNFVSYLRGISVSASFLIEFVFDYINLLGFLLRTFVQNVRFLIIILVCFSINELWVYYDLTQTFFFYDTQTFDDVLNLNFSYFTKFYYIVFFFFKQFIYIIYEIIHTFFVILIQLSSFLIMTFWLFSFLYTYFSISIHEQYFEQYRLKKFFNK
jgi:hypothetical protein